VRDTSVFKRPNVWGKLGKEGSASLVSALALLTSTDTNEALPL